VDAVAHEAADGSLDYESFMLWARKKATPTGEVSRGGIAGWDTQHVVADGEQDADKVIAHPASNGARATSGVRFGEEMKRISEHVAFARQRVA
jgi:hypothetical protein